MKKDVICIPATKSIIGTDPSQILNVAAYCRVSSQSNEQYGSLEVQESIILTTLMIMLAGALPVFMPKQAPVETSKWVFIMVLRKATSACEKSSSVDYKSRSL